jgi:acyl-coenzyme A synthetase/AMP-(fatty) acid ligase
MNYRSVRIWLESSVLFTRCVALQKVYKPREHNKLTTLRHIYSTGSPLSPVLFDFVYEHIKEKVLLASITGERGRIHLLGHTLSAMF